MDLNLRVIHSRDFLRATPTGKLDLESSKQLLRTLAAENASTDKYDFLIDIRQTESRLSLMDVTELVEVMMEHTDAFTSRIGILTPHEATLEIAKFMELYAKNRGFRVAAFRDYEEVMNWLMTSSQPTRGASGG